MARSTADLTICVPAFNEEKSIERVLTSLKESFPDSQVIVVDDGSTDGTAAALTRVPGITIMTNSRNRGYGASLKRAMAKATGSVVSWFDADGQHSVQDLLSVASPVLMGEADAAIGVRSSASHVVRGRTMGKMLLKWVAEFVAKQQIPDLNSGLRCFDKRIVFHFLHLLPDGFSASTTSTLVMMKQNYSIAYAPITTAERVGESSVRIGRDGAATLKLILHILVLFEAFKFFTFLSVVQLVPAVAYGIGMALYYQMGLPILAGVVAISGVLTFMVGIVCDQITHLRKEGFDRYAD